MRVFSMVGALALAMVALTGTARAAEVRVISSNALTEVLAVLGPQFEKATGNTLVVHYDTTTVLKKDILGGEAFDVAILTGPAIDDLVHASKVDPATRAEVARSGVGVAYKTGAPAPDIHDAASFKNAMLAAHSVAYTTAGASGLYFMSVCEKLGIADQVKAKSKVLPVAVSPNWSRVAKPSSPLSRSASCCRLPVCRSCRSRPTCRCTARFLLPSRRRANNRKQQRR